MLAIPPLLLTIMVIHRNLLTSNQCWSVICTHIKHDSDEPHYIPGLKKNPCQRRRTRHTIHPKDGEQHTQLTPKTENNTHNSSQRRRTTYKTHPKVGEQHTQLTAKTENTHNSPQRQRTTHTQTHPRDREHTHPTDGKHHTQLTPKMENTHTVTHTRPHTHPRDREHTHPTEGKHHTQLTPKMETTHTHTLNSLQRWRTTHTHTQLTPKMETTHTHTQLTPKMENNTHTLNSPQRWRTTHTHSTHPKDGEEHNYTTHHEGLAPGVGGRGQSVRHQGLGDRALRRQGGQVLPRPHQHLPAGGPRVHMSVLKPKSRFSPWSANRVPWNNVPAHHGADRGRLGLSGQGSRRTGDWRGRRGGRERKCRWTVDYYTIGYLDGPGRRMQVNYLSKWGNLENRWNNYWKNKNKHKNNPHTHIHRQVDSTQRN